VLDDPLKANIAEMIGRLKNLGVNLKIITGDNRLIATTVGRQMGLANPQILTGSEIRQISNATLLVVAATLIFPFTPLANILGFQRLPASVLLFLGIIIMAYIVAAEWAKRVFYKKMKY
jgi:hypothetical protein